MRLLIDASGADPTAGGMWTHARGVIGEWSRHYPEDDLFVVGHPLLEASGTKPFRSPRSHRAVVQTLLIPPIANRVGPDAILSLSPVLSPLLGQTPKFNVVHDWRHIEEPTSFSKSQLAYRRLWRDSVRRATRTFAVSKSTARATLQLVPSAQISVAANGVNSLPLPAPRAIGMSEKVHLLTFATHANKRPELVIRALAMIEPDLRRRLQLTVTGGSSEVRQSLLALAEDVQVAHQVTFPGHLTDDDYVACFSRAQVIILASRNEGFGLPIGEAVVSGRQAIVTTDAGVPEVLSRYAHVTMPDPNSIARAVSASVFSPIKLNSLDLPKWSDTVTILRRGIVDSF